MSIKKNIEANTDCITNTGVMDAKELDNKLTLECKKEQDDNPDSNRNILSEIAEQLVDLNKTIPDHLLSDEDMPPTLERKPDLISIDIEREVYETQPELKRAISEIDETHKGETCAISQNITSNQDVCSKFDLEVVQKNTDTVLHEVVNVESKELSMPGNPIEIVSNVSEQEKIISDIRDETDSHTSLKKKKKSKVLKNETDDTNAEDINVSDDVAKTKNSKNPLKKKFDNNQEDGEVKKKSKKMKDKKKKLKKHKNPKDSDDKDSNKESQEGDLSKKEKKKRDDKIDSTIASVLGQKKGENSKKVKKCRKNKDKNSPKKGDSLAEKKIKRKKKKKDASALEADEKSSNDQTTSDSDKAAKMKKGKKKDKKKSKKKTCESVELLDKPIEETTDIPEEKPSCKEPEEEEKVEDPETTLESDEKIKEEEEISFLLCQEHVPASPLGDELIEEEEVPLYRLSHSEHSEMPIHSIIQSSSYAEHSLSNELPPLPSENVHSVINKHSEMLTVLENTPPTTPESTGTFLSNSPSYDQDMLSPESRSPHKDTPETENDNSYEGPTHLDVMESEDSRTESAILFLANQAVCRNKVLPTKRPSECSDILPPRKKKPTKFYSCDTSIRTKSSSKSGSKGEQKDPDVSSTTGNSSSDSASTVTTGSQPVRTSRFNFYVPLDDTMDSDRRIAVIQNSLSELKKAYMALKAEVATIDRHRKKAKRKEKELAATTATSAINTSAQKDGTDTS